MAPNPTSYLKNIPELSVSSQIWTISKSNQIKEICKIGEKVEQQILNLYPKKAPFCGSDADIKSLFNLDIFK